MQTQRPVERVRSKLLIDSLAVTLDVNRCVIQSTYFDSEILIELDSTAMLFAFPKVKSADKMS